MLVVFMPICGAAALAGVLRTHPMPALQFFSLVMIGIAGSRLNAKLPRLTDNMSASLHPLLAALQLSFFEVLMVALSQVQLLVNLNTTGSPSQLRQVVSHGKWLSNWTEMLCGQFSNRPSCCQLNVPPRPKNFRNIDHGGPFWNPVLKCRAVSTSLQSTDHLESVCPINKKRFSLWIIKSSLVWCSDCLPLVVRLCL